MFLTCDSSCFLKVSVVIDDNMDVYSETSRCLARISTTGHAYTRPDITSIGFTSNECKILATRQRCTNHLLHLYSDKGEPLTREHIKKSLNSFNSIVEHSSQTKGENAKNNLLALLRRNEGVRHSLYSARSRKMEKSQRSLTADARRASIAELETKATVEDPLGAIIIRSLNQDLSPSLRLERFLINLQKEGYLTCSKKEDRKNVNKELTRTMTPKGAVCLKSKFLPHPPVYLFERNDKDSFFNKIV